jgi:hypothetical protein
MVHGVVHTFPPFFVQNFEFPGGTRGLVVTPIQSQKVRVERGYVLGEECRRIPLGIHGDEQHLDCAGLGPHLLEGESQFAQRCGTYIGTSCITEEQDDHLAPEIRQGATPPGRVTQTEVARESRTGHVRRLKLRCRSRMTAGRQQRSEQQNERQANDHEWRRGRVPVRYLAVFTATSNPADPFR